ncbi:unnamed protein product [Amoebophrya sp. A25]|nr:unnamed protein product [Amoebophrya sp. A25]|eukprot:GSA25T00008098001.1
MPSASTSLLRNESGTTISGEENNRMAADLDDDKVEALIFDCDGTLVNSMEYFWQGWEVLCKKYELNFPKTRFYALAGTPIREIVHIVLTETDPAIVEKLVSVEKGDDETKRRELFVDRFLAEKLEAIEELRSRGLFPGEITCVTKIAKQAKERKMRIGVASSGEKNHVLADLAHHNLTDLFETIVTREDVVHGKPAPDLFLEAANRLNVDPKRCRGYEDADLGLESLRRAEFVQAVDVRLMKGYPN